MSEPLVFNVLSNWKIGLSHVGWIQHFRGLFLLEIFSSQFFQCLSILLDPGCGGSGGGESAEHRRASVSFNSASSIRNCLFPSNSSERLTHGWADILSSEARRAWVWTHRSCKLQNLTVGCWLTWDVTVTSSEWRCVCLCRKRWRWAERSTAVCLAGSRST